MKLLLLCLLCLLAVASGRLVFDKLTKPKTFPSLDPTDPGKDDFLVLASVKDDDDLDPDEVQILEQNGTVSTALNAVLAVSGSSFRKSLSQDEKGLPPAYASSAKNSSAALFDQSSAKNEKEKELQDPLARKTVTLSSLYHCPHTTYLLRWFPLYLSRKLYEICFIPWATNQAITYAKCSTSSCSTGYWYYYPYYPYRKQRYGRCSVSCYVRINIRAYCVRLSTLTVSWKTVRRNLPQACRCSTKW
ncbi:uncharacterized protein [Littorina saxatilis]|uniref:Uncharacterized protein n=1 Tax=Littorina saxatilis TaxID=31220 RepID=A0AAN9GDG9_9CAEN